MEHPDALQAPSQRELAGRQARLREFSCRILPAYDQRLLRRAIVTNIEDKLSEKILEGEIEKGSTVVCDYKENEFVFESEE